MPRRLWCHYRNIDSVCSVGNWSLLSSAKSPQKSFPSSGHGSYCYTDWRIIDSERLSRLGWRQRSLLDSSYLRNFSALPRQFCSPRLGLGFCSIYWPWIFGFRVNHHLWSVSFEEHDSTMLTLIVERFGSPIMKSTSVVMGLLVGCIIAAATGYFDRSGIDAAPAVSFIWVHTFKLSVYGPIVLPLLAVSRNANSKALRLTLLTRYTSC